jgi:hypothetical protein
MKTFLDRILKALTGALAVGIFLAAAGSHVLPLTVPLLTVGGRKLFLNMLMLSESSCLCACQQPSFTSLATAPGKL